MSIITNFVLGAVCSQWIDSGLANFLGVETLKHGTHPVAYANIRWRGADPDYGLPPTAHSKDRYFFLFKAHIPWGIRVFNPRYHAGASAHFAITSRISHLPSPVSNIVSLGYTFAAVALVPTLNFRFCQKELQHKVEQKHFENDPGYCFGAPLEQSYAYMTKEKIEARRIGLVGTLFAGVNREWVKRVQENPLRCAKGVVQLTGAALLSWYCGSSVKTAAFLTGAILA